MPLAIDSSTPAVATQSNANAAACTTASFTPPVGSMLLLRYASNSTGGVNPSQPSVTDSLGAHLTYNLLDWQSRADSPNVDGIAASWWASIASSAAMTVTVNSGVSAGNKEAALQVAVLTGQAASPIGAHGKSGSASASSIAQSYTGQVSGGWGFIAICDWAALGAETAGAGCTISGTGSATGNVGVGQISYGFGRRTNADDTGGLSSTLNITIPGTSTALSWTYVEILPAIPPAVVMSPTAMHRSYAW